MEWIQICAYQLGASRKPRECAEAGGRIALQPSIKAAVVVERDQFGVLSFFLSLFLLIGCGPVQMASAWDLSASDHSQVEVEFPRVPYPQDDHGICFMFVCAFLECGDAAQEVCD
jgi:hypothetical protein